MREIGMFLGKRINEEMSKEELLNIIEHLGKENNRLQEEGSRYLQAADPVKLLSLRDRLEG